jgi:hypothetical protein
VSGGVVNIFDPVFSSSQVAKAAGMTASNFRAHLARGNWRIVGGSTGGEKAEMFGQGHAFTIFDALGYALANRLIALGLAPKEAFERAMFDFAHVGDELRDPGGIFDVAKFGLTLFVYVTGAERGECIPSATITDATLLLYPPGQRRGGEAIIVCINDLREKVFRHLGLDARDFE